MPKIDKTRVLVAPLDWGLGHATRCIPVIRELLKADFEVLIAAEGKVKVVLELEFPFLQFLSLRGYDIQYGRTRFQLFLKILVQTPRILAAIKYEHKWLQQVVKEQNIRIVISDNRYGFHSKRTHSVFITHQLSIQASVLSKIVQQINYGYINHFDTCWVPDMNKGNGLAGSLSHPKSLPQIPTKYIGTLSRFEYEGESDAKHLLVLLSGPEPQRSILEQKLLAELSSYTLPVVLVRGLPRDKIGLDGLPSNVQVYTHLQASNLEKVIREASLVVARCGYSTVMDLTRLRKKSVLIPTPGQTEQEYLAKHLLKSRIAYAISQKDFNLDKALTAAASFSYQIVDDKYESFLKDAIADLSMLP